MKVNFLSSVALSAVILVGVSSAAKAEEALASVPDSQSALLLATAEELPQLGEGPYGDVSPEAFARIVLQSNSVCTTLLQDEVQTGVLWETFDELPFSSPIAAVAAVLSAVNRGEENMEFKSYFPGVQVARYNEPDTDFVLGYRVVIECKSSI